MIFGVLLKTGSNEVLPYLLPASSPTPFLVVEPPCVSLPRGGLPNRLAHVASSSTTSFFHQDSRTVSARVSTMSSVGVRKNCCENLFLNIQTRRHRVPRHQPALGLSHPLGLWFVEHCQGERDVMDEADSSKFSPLSTDRHWCSVPALLKPSTCASIPAIIST